MNTFELLLIIVAALVVMVAFWAGVLWLLALLSGWRALARRYAAEREPEGDYYGMAGGSFGWVHFNGVLRVWVGERGIGLGCMMPAAFGAMETLLLPWRAIESVDERQILFLRKVRIHVADHGQVIQLRGAAGQAVLREWNKRQSG